jgi:hypothetical protein
MPTIDPTRTLAELDIGLPGWGAVLDRLGLDGCGGGQPFPVDSARS